jgi:5-methylcytosine-specific restriction endonuclease McrA
VPTPADFRWYQLTFWKIKRGRMRSRLTRFKNNLRSRKCREEMLERLIERTKGISRVGQYQRIGTVPVEDILPLIYEQTRITLFGEEIKLTSRRYKCYKERGVKCVSCGIEGHHFAVERQLKENKEECPYHLNLYHRSREGHDVLMTVDHIIPKAKGGSNSLRNLQPMCCICNSSKADRMPKRNRPYPGLKKVTKIDA